jgi:hypothetical protein
MALNIAPSLANTPGVNQTNILNALVPPEGPKSAAVTLDFSLTDTVLVDFTITTAQGKLSTVQMIFVDNYANPAPLNVQVSGTSQTIRVPAGIQGWFPVVATNRPKFTCVTDPGVIVIALFLNVPVAQGQWDPDGNGLTVAQSPLAFVVAVGGTPVAAFATTATSQVPTEGAIITNPFSATESLFVDIVNAAQTSAPGTNGTTVELKAGGSFVVPPNFSGVVSVNAVTSAHAFTAYGAGAELP